MTLWLTLICVIQILVQFCWYKGNTEQTDDDDFGYDSQAGDENEKADIV